MVSLSSDLCPLHCAAVTNYSPGGFMTFISSAHCKWWHTDITLFSICCFFFLKSTPFDVSSIVATAVLCSLIGSHGNGSHLLDLGLGLHVDKLPLPGKCSLQPGQVLLLDITYTLTMTLMIFQNQNKNWFICFSKMSKMQLRLWISSVKVTGGCLSSCSTNKSIQRGNSSGRGRVEGSPPHNLPTPASSCSAWFACTDR